MSNHFTTVTAQIMKCKLQERFSFRARFVFSLLTLFAVVLIHVVMQMRRKALAEAERKHNIPRVIITTLGKANGRSSVRLSS